VLYFELGIQILIIIEVLVLPNTAFAVMGNDLSTTNTPPGLSSPIRNGVLCSLYSSLTPAEAELLEEAISHASLGARDEAAKIFEGLTRPMNLKPVIAIEYGRFLMEEWRYKDAHLILQQSLQEACSNTVSAEETLLLRALSARVEIQYRGSFIHAKSCMDDLHAWLQDVRVGDYTDLQVQSTSFPNALLIQ
jgi:hypothetical protein